MAIRVVRNTIQSEFISQWASRTEIALQNQDYNPTSQQPWVRLTIAPVDGTQITLGDGGGAPNRRFRKFGIVNIQIFTPVNDATDSNDTLADAAELIFQGRTIDNIRFRDTRIVEVGESDDWYQQNVLSDIEYDEHN